MNNWLRTRLLLVLFIASLAFLSFSYGLVAGIADLPPAPRARVLVDQVREFPQYWRNDLGLEPTRHLVDAYPDRQGGFVVYRPDEMREGAILISGLTPGRDALNSVVLYTSEGEERHVWSVDYGELDPDGREPQNVFLHGMAVLRDGSIVVNFDAGRRLTRLHACGEPLWNVEGNYHHTVTATGDGRLWTLKRGNLAQVDDDTGVVLKQISADWDLFPKHHAILGIRTEESPDDVEIPSEAFHMNHLEALSPRLAPAFPMFEVGDLLVSMRELNLVMVIDPETLDMKWHKIGPWHRQHNPHFLPDGTIVVYNNNMSFDPSQILSVDPATNEVRVLFEGRDDAPFYSWRRGTVQALDDGRLLVTESERGRVFMVNSEGELVFEYNNVFDEERNGVLNTARYLQPGFFENGALDCPPTSSADEVAAG